MSEGDTTVLGCLVRALPKLRRARFWREALVQATRLAHLLDATADPRRRRRLAAAWCRLLVAGRAGRRNPIEIEWDGPAGALRASVSDLSELRAVAEVFVDRCYAISATREPRTIVDLGANVGIAALYFKSRWPRARIVAVEPQPLTYRLLRDNVAHLAGVETVQCAITEAGGPVTMYCGAESWSSGLTPDPRRTRACTVAGVTFDELVRDRALDHVDLLKVDIEGAEGAVMNASSSALSRVERVVFEYHARLAGTTLWQLLGGLPEFRPVSVRGNSDGQAVVELVHR